jgi:hypothetical protein
MKKYIGAFCLMFISFTATASSTSKMAYDYMTLDLLNNVSACSAELAKATENDRVVLKADGNFESAADHALYTFTLTIGRRLSYPDSGEVEMSKLVISKRILAAKQKPGQDSPPVWEKAECHSFAVTK